ncbi:MAG TPA: PEP-CTERM sorting domain-containing protein [Planctomycetaceae bacterium]|nr:PEP-CTERM sorting domain-containing protein [Planctomycetaceae bacterium]
MQNRKQLVSAMAVFGLVSIAASRADASAITLSNTAGQRGGDITIGATVQIGDGSGTASVDDGVISAADAFPGAFSSISGICGTSGTFGCLELSTGAFIGSDPLTAGVNDYLYSGTGSYIRIFGDATADGGDSSRLLYSGSFDATTNIRLTFDSNCPGNCSGSLTGTIDGGLLDPYLASYLGVNATTDGGNATTLFLSFAGISNPTSGPPTGTALGNTNSLQTFDVSEVPEPASLLLFSAGILGLARIARRRPVRK